MSEPSVDDYIDEFDVGQSLSVDFGTELQLEIDGVDRRLRSEIVGMARGKYIIVKTPTLSELGGISIKLFGGNRVVVRYVYRGSVFGFETTIMEEVSSPVRVLFLSYPKVVNERNIRSSQRLETALPARLGSGDEAVEGTVTDISISGCHFEAKTAKLGEGLDLKVDREVELTLQLPGVAGEFQIRGNLKNLSKGARTTEVGIAFGELDENVQLAIDAYVKLSD